MNVGDTWSVLVAGGSGGLGRAVVAELARSGHRVLAGWRTRPPGELPPGAQAIRIDLGDDASCRAAVGHAEALHGRLDALVHCAGLAGDGLVARAGVADWDAVFSANLDGAMRLARAALAPMLRRRSGHIVHVGSFAGLAGAEGRAIYAASKAALHGLTVALAREAGPHGVRVNTVLPGVLRTPMTERLGPERLAAFAADNVLGRLGDPAESARFIVFLLGARDVSGQIFNLDSRIHRWA